MTIGEQIRYFRKKRGMTMVELAKKIGVSGRGVVYDYEKGRVIPSFPILNKIAEVLECDYIQELRGELPLP